MAVIYTDSSHNDVGILHEATLDFEYGQKTDNDFTCEVPIESHCCDYGSYIYIEETDADGNVIHTDLGGEVTCIAPSTKNDTVTYSGSTWQGLLANHILCPDSGADYLVLSGDANAVLGTLITRCGIGDLFVASSEVSGFTLKSYQMDRYVDAYTGILKMLKSVGAKLKIAFDGYNVNLSAVAIVDYSTDEEWDSDQFTMKVTKSKRFLNHVICAGSGELKDRLIVNLYQDADGNVSATQTLTGINEVCELYDAGSVSDSASLTEKGADLLNTAYESANKIETDFSSAQDYDVGDVVGSTERITGVSVSAPIISKVVKLDDTTLTITCKVGEN